MPSAVPAPLASIAGRLRCPTCLRTLAPVQGSLACSRGHSYDVARHGYVTLLPAVRRSPVGDDAGMLAARAAIQNAGYFEPLSAALAETARALCPPGSSVVLDAGAGTASPSWRRARHPPRRAGRGRGHFACRLAPSGTSAQSDRVGARRHLARDPARGRDRRSGAQRVRPTQRRGACPCPSTWRSGDSGNARRRAPPRTRDVPHDPHRSREGRSLARALLRMAKR